MTTFIYFIPLFGVLSLLFALSKAISILKSERGSSKMQEISSYIHEGAMAFLSREFKTLLIFVIIVAVLLIYSSTKSKESPLVAIAFIYGAISSAIAGFCGMKIATRANERTAQAARKSLQNALSIAFSGGLVTGMCVVGLGIFGIGLLYLIFVVFREIPFEKIPFMMNAISGFSMGASSIALFARVGGGIYTKAADVGADLVGKIEAGIPEDDPRNPAVIADLVGDNVGDVAGMSADLFESYVASLVAAMVLGCIISWNAILLPMLLYCLGTIASIVGTTVVRTKEGANPQKALNNGTYLSGLIMLVGTYFVSKFVLPEEIVYQLMGKKVILTGMRCFWATSCGLIAGVAIGYIAEYFTSANRNPTKSISTASQTGAATNIIMGIAVGMQSTTIPIIVLAGATIISYGMAGLYGIALAGLGMLSTLGINLAVDAYGPIADNAGGIAEMSGLPEETKKRTSTLDAVGNTTAAIGKGFAIGSAGLTALALFCAFSQSTHIESINLTNAYVIGGLFLGAMVPFLFCSLTILAVGKAAFNMVEEVRNQFKTIVGLMEGKAKADYKRCVDISTAAALKRMILPGSIAIILPLIIGIYNIEMLGGFLAGSTATGVLLAIFLANSGGAWDNAKKYIEDGNFGGKGSPSHKAAVVGDTVGDPFKDTAGPSLNILIKLMSVVSLVFSPLFVLMHRL